MRDRALEVIALRESDWPALRALRLFALESEPGVFSSKYDDERYKLESEWRELASNTSDRQRIFGVFDGPELVGITAAFTDRGDPSGSTAILAMSFLQPAYRGLGVSRAMYQARLDWILTVRRFQTIRVAHRRSNEASRRANQRFGFVQIQALPLTWPDGITEDEVIYELPTTALD
jgi:RimJ/RimL family protein N-acetyltransferase